MSNPEILSLTTGDVDGIGYEVCVKALLKVKPPKHQRIILWRSPYSIKKYSAMLMARYKTERFSNATEALEFFNSRNSKQVPVIEIVNDDSPAHWVEESALLCVKGKVSALVTGPLSKGVIYKAGMKDMGHTGILSRVTKTKKVYMTFLGSKFNVLCVTGHIALNKVEINLAKETILTSLSLALDLRKYLPKEQSKLPIGILGLNPHASESGLIGDFDLGLQKLINSLGRSELFCGPLVPDAAFLKSNWKKFSLFICLYHDQGLIPFKLVHGQDSGAHYSLGLPIVRTSVDHGTAKDIFSKDKANCNSMLDAIRWASKLRPST
jgi:4-hydroxythreonine-4-phosphate dehydrogenase